MSNKIDVTSTALEKGIDLAKDFLGKLIIPPIEETGLLLKDKVTMWRFNNQVKMLIKANDICEKFHIQPKTVSLKVLCPLLDYAGLEDSDILQDKWANLLTNMVDSEQNIENHVFPYLLSQVSVDEFLLIENIYNMKIEKVKKLEKELEEFLLTKPIIEQEIREHLQRLDQEMLEEKEKNKYPYEIQRKKWDKEKELRDLESKERNFKYMIKQPEYIPSSELRDYEIANLIRLGVVKSISRPFAYVGEHKIKNDPDSEYLYLQDLEILVENEADDLVLTELGVLLAAACNKKK
jgi:hypothetical protein